MPNEFDKSGMIHQWIYVVIPVGMYNMPTFCAFCKSCRLYFTERMKYTETGLHAISGSSLPKYGCMPPDDIPVI